MTSPPIPPNFSHRIWTIHRNDLIEQWGGQFPPSPPRGAATDLQFRMFIRPKAIYSRSQRRGTGYTCSDFVSFLFQYEPGFFNEFNQYFILHQS